MRFLTFNLWHGLSPSSPVAFEALEPTGRRSARERLQVELLRSLEPDVCFFQEVNPVGVRAPAFADALGMTYSYQPDLVGLKLFGVGLPLNLNSGLVTLARPSFSLRKVEGASLSRPGLHLVHGWGSWQLKEERFALFSESMVPRWGRVLLIDTHLHHGLEATSEFVDALHRLAKEIDLSEATVSEVLARLARGGERRTAELQELLRVLERHERRYEVVILAGDFNASPESELGGLLRERGFRDVWLDAHPEGGGLTYDETANEANHLMQAGFPLTLVVEDLSFSAKTKEALLALAHRQESRPRRIDYIWIRSQNLDLQVDRVQMVGFPNAEGFAPSDHFGVCADIELV